MRKRDQDGSGAGASVFAVPEEEAPEQYEYVSTSDDDSIDDDAPEPPPKRTRRIPLHPPLSQERTGAGMDVLLGAGSGMALQLGLAQIGEGFAVSDTLVQRQAQNLGLS